MLHTHMQSSTYTFVLQCVVLRTLTNTAIFQQITPCAARTPRGSPTNSFRNGAISTLCY